MNDKSDDSDQIVKEALLNLGVPKDFLDRLLAEPEDWSYIIKIHALLEAACSNAIVEHLGEPALLRVISFLEMSSLRNGKLGILKDALLISENCIPFIQGLSEIRNELVHKVANVTFSFQGIHSEELDTKLKNLKRGIIRFWSDPKNDPTTVTRRDKDFAARFFQASPRLAISQACFWIIAKLGVVKLKAQTRKEQLKLAELLARRITKTT